MLWLLISLFKVKAMLEHDIFPLINLFSRRVKPAKKEHNSADVLIGTDA